MIPFVISLIVTALGAIIYSVSNNKPSELGRAMFWLGLGFALYYLPLVVAWAK